MSQMESAKAIVAKLIDNDVNEQVASAVGAYTWLVTAYVKERDADGARGVMAEMQAATW